MSLVAFRKPALAEESVTERDIVHNSMGFAIVCEHLRKQEPPVVLDLGSLVSANIEFLSQFRCKLFIEDLAEGLNELNRLSSEDRLTDIHNHLQTYGNTQFDLILVWDLFNYLERRAMAALVEYLIQYSHRDTLMFSLICTRKQMREQPSRFEIVSEQQLRYEIDADAKRPCPYHNGTRILRDLPQFAAERTYLLRNGMQEYVFRFQSD